jgi:hypothetical protein
MPINELRCLQSATNLFESDIFLILERNKFKIGVVHEILSSRLFWWSNVRDAFVSLEGSRNVSLGILPKVECLCPVQHPPEISQNEEIIKPQIVISHPNKTHSKVLEPEAPRVNRITSQDPNASRVFVLVLCVLLRCWFACVCCFGSGDSESGIS